MTTPEQKLDDAINFIVTSREQLKEGTVVSMDGFQDVVAELCVDLGKLPVGEMTRLSEKLNVFAEGLQALEDELKEQQDQVQNEIQNLALKQKALKSYESTSHSDKKEGDE